MHLAQPLASNLVCCVILSGAYGAVERSRAGYRNAHLNLSVRAQKPPACSGREEDILWHSAACFLQKHWLKYAAVLYYIWLKPMQQGYDYISMFGVYTAPDGSQTILTYMNRCTNAIGRYAFNIYVPSDSESWYTRNMMLYITIV